MDLSKKNRFSAEEAMNHILRTEEKKEGNNMRNAQVQ